MTELDTIIELITSTRDKAMLKDFLTGLTTEKERRELAMRVEIIQRILSGQPHQKIARDLGVGVATVTRGSKEIAQGRFKIMRNSHE